jgi:aspartate carbamoyltransferase catalytic subunit
MKHLLSVDDLEKDDIVNIFDLASYVEQNWTKIDRYGDLSGMSYATNKCVASFFAEPSTRTRLSFERAIQWMGGHVLSVADASSSSISKGESLKDTFRTIGQYADMIIFRHGDEKWPDIAKEYSRVPVINAGSGAKEHPTQALLDLYTIEKEIGGIKGKNILFCGDLLFGRTVHSLIKLLTKYYNCKIYLCPATVETLSGPKSLMLPNEYSDNLCYVDVGFALKILPTMDIVYMTRVQKERMKNDLAPYPKIDNLELTLPIVNTMKHNSAILHPLPRNGEISEEVDDDPRAAYHERQLRNGLYIRVAVMEYLMEK